MGVVVRERRERERSRSERGNTDLELTRFMTCGGGDAVVGVRGSC